MILGYKSPQKFFEGANMCPGRRKKTSPCTWENTPPCEKALLCMGKSFHTSTHRRLVSQWRGQKAPQLFKGPGPEKRVGLSAWEKHASL